jgi:hypothetical protein
MPCNTPAKLGTPLDKYQATVKNNGPPETGRKETQKEETP